MAFPFGENPNTKIPSPARPDEDCPQLPAVPVYLNKRAFPNP